MPVPHAPVRRACSSHGWQDGQRHLVDAPESAVILIDDHILDGDDPGKLAIALHEQAEKP
ncbi:hypothetical protein ACFYSC_15945 [Streptosporangium sp. NPDC004379]|uniref:hypothetical protein n=1 Tax=Streptosporangium sp. NPDC004379 TaxID=3366189 RepID=UPI0036899EA1